MDNQIEVTGSIGIAHYHTEIFASGHTLICDEPEQSGGTNTGPGPAEFLAASLASCTAITLRMYADRKGWKLSQADIKVSIIRDKARNITRIDREITLLGTLSSEEKVRLLEIANKCPVHQILSNPIEIHTQLTP